MTFRRGNISNEPLADGVLFNKNAIRTGIFCPLIVSQNSPVCLCSTNVLQNLSGVGRLRNLSNLYVSRNLLRTVSDGNVPFIAQIIRVIRELLFNIVLRVAYAAAMVHSQYLDRLA